MRIIVGLLINTIALYIVDYLVPGVSFTDFRAIIVSAVLLAIANKFIKPVLHFIFFPLTLITFGLAAFFVNVLILWGVSRVVPGFAIVGFLPTLISSILITLISVFLREMEKDEK